MDCHRFVVRKINYSSPKISGKLRVAFLTDLHSKSFGRNNEKLIKAIREAKPDAILISGDMITAIKNENTQIAFLLIKELCRDYPVYYSNGNHEKKALIKKDEFDDRFVRFIEALQNEGVIFLNNEKRDIEHNITVYGLDLPFEYYKKSKRIVLGKDEIDGYLGDMDRNRFNIMLAHNPEYFESYALTNADFVLSGHFHGGLARLPILHGVISPRYEIFPKYSYGFYFKDNTTMYLSCGLGTHTLPARFFNPGELTIIDFEEKTEVI